MLAHVELQGEFVLVDFSGDEPLQLRPELLTDLLKGASVAWIATFVGS